MVMEMGSNAPISRKPGKDTAPQIVLSQRELTTRFQVETVLQVLGMSVSAMVIIFTPRRQDSTG